MHGIKHRLTKVYDSWTNGQVERMNRTIKEATINAFRYPDSAVLKAYVLAFMMAYNFARHLKALRWCTPFKVTCEASTKNPERLITNSHHLIPAPYSRPASEYRDHQPGAGQTDLDLLKFPTIIFMQSGWNVYTL